MEKNEIFTFMSESGGSSRVESSVYQKKKKKSHYELSGIREGEGKKVHEILPPTCQIIGNFYI